MNTEEGRVGKEGREGYEGPLARMNVSQNSNGFAENKIQGDWLGIQQTLKL